jgi:hypothetical protein
MKIYHEHMFKGSGAIAFNYCIFREGVVRAVIWDIATYRYDDNKFKWRKFGKAIVPSFTRRWERIEDFLAEENPPKPPRYGWAGNSIVWTAQ